MYFSLSAVLMRAGLSSKIHACTIAAMELFAFEADEIEKMERSMHARIEAQYALDPTSEIDEIVAYAPTFSLRCIQILNTLDETSIKAIRTRLEKSPHTHEHRS